MIIKIPDIDMNIEDKIILTRQLEIGKQLFDDILHALDDIHADGYSDGTKIYLVITTNI